MTFEQKVEKLRGIVDTGIRIWCQTTDEDAEFIKIANEVYGKNVYTEYSIQAGATYKVIYSKDNDGEIDVNYVGNERSIIGLDNYIPYSEFFADKVENKPLGEWTLNEVKEYCSKKNLDCQECIFVKNNSCFYNDNPEEWDLTPIKLTLTQSEIDILKAIKLICDDAKILEYDVDSESYLVDNGLLAVNEDKLPTLSKFAMKEYSIDELLGVN